MNDAEIRADVLDTAKGYVLKDRNSTYGSPEDNFRRIAELWTAYLKIRPVDAGAPVTSIDVAQMMLLMKVARLAHNPTHKDSWVDAAGYAACGAGIALVSPAQQGPAAGTKVVEISGIGPCVITSEKDRTDFENIAAAIRKAEAKQPFNHPTSPRT